MSRWLLFGVVIGVVSGLGAVGFYWCLSHATQWLLVDLGGYLPPTTRGEGTGFPGADFARPWAIPAVTGGAALVAGILVACIAPEARGHGTDAAIAAVHHNPTGLRLRAALVKVVASSLIIGSGGSGGREGPTAQISATVISRLCGALRIPVPTPASPWRPPWPQVSARSFARPWEGPCSEPSCSYRDDLEADAIMPGLISSIVAFAVYGSVYGFQPIFGTMSGLTFVHPAELLWFAVVGVAAGLLGRWYAQAFYAGGALLQRLPVPRAILPAIGGLCVGLLGLAVPAVLGTGYGWTQLQMTSGWMLSSPLWLVLVIPFAKIVATTLSIGSGARAASSGPAW